MMDGDKGGSAMIVMMAKKRRDHKKNGGMEMDSKEKNHSLMAAEAMKRSKKKGMKGC